MFSLAVLAVVQSVPIEVNHQPFFSYQTHIPSVHKAPVYHQHHVVEEHHNAPAQYDFSYSVHDDHTGDIKSQQESRRGDAVHGKYELIDSDGYKRIVEYTADKHSGFNAVVHRVPTNIKIPIPKSHYAPKTLSAVHYVPSTPVHYSPAKYVSVAPVHYAPAPAFHYAPAKYAAPAPTHYAPPKYVADGTHVSVSLPSVQYKY